MKIKISLLIMILATFSAFSQTDRIDNFIASQMKLRKIPGLQLAITKNGKIIKAKSYGIANIEDSGNFGMSIWNWEKEQLNFSKISN